MFISRASVVVRVQADAHAVAAGHVGALVVAAAILAVELQKTIRQARSSGAAPATKRAGKGMQYPSKKDWKQLSVHRLNGYLA